MIQLTLLELLLEDGSVAAQDCVYDYLKVYDGSAQSSLLFHDRPLCRQLGPAGARMRPVYPLSTSNKVYIVFKSDSAGWSKRYKGFQLAWVQQGMVKYSHTLLVQNHMR